MYNKIFQNTSQKTLLLFILFFSYIDCAKIGIVCEKQCPSGTAPYYSPVLIKKLNAMGYKANLAYVGSNFDSYDLLITMYDNIPKHLQHKTILLIHEPPVVKPTLHNFSITNKYGIIFHTNHDLSTQSKKYKRVFFPELYLRNSSFIPFHKRKFSCLINSFLRQFTHRKNELYTLRRQVVDHYNKKHPAQLSLYGARGWNKKLKIYKGICKDKYSILEAHKFSYCFENWKNDEHYISEKILHCLACKCVPIYLGSSRITDYIPKETFIDARKFNSIEEMHQFIANMDEQTWLTYIEAIEKFLTSKSAKHFSIKRYHEQIIESATSLLKKTKKMRNSQ